MVIRTIGIVLIVLLLSMIAGVTFADDGETSPEPTPVAEPIPTFGVISISDQVFVTNKKIQGVIMPQAYPLDHNFYYDMSVPLGIEFNPETREITGTPTEVGTWDSLVYRAYNNEQYQDFLIFKLSIVNSIEQEAVQLVTPNPEIINTERDNKDVSHVDSFDIIPTPTTKERLTNSAKEAVDETADLIDNALDGKVSPVSINTSEDNSLTMIVIGIFIGIIFVFIILHMITNMMKGVNR